MQRNARMIRTHKVTVFSYILAVGVLITITSLSGTIQAGIGKAYDIELASSEKSLVVEHQGFGTAFNDMVGSSTINDVEISRTSTVVRLNDVQLGDHLYIFMLTESDETIFGTWKVELLMNGARLGNAVEITQKVPEEGIEYVLVIASLGNDLPYDDFEIKVK